MVQKKWTFWIFVDCLQIGLTQPYMENLLSSVAYIYLDSDTNERHIKFLFNYDQF